MPLPSIDHPIHTTVLPISGKIVQFRPILMKEHKIVMLAQQLDDITNTIETLSKVVSGCTLGEVDVHDLAYVDFEWLFLQIRAKSFGEFHELRYICKNPVEKEGKMQPCDAPILTGINLTEIKVVFDPANLLIQLTDTVGLKMKIPTFREMMSSPSDKTLMDMSTDVLVSSIEYVFDENKVYSRGTDFTDADLKDFLDNLSPDYQEKIAVFFEIGFPKLTYEIEVRCKRCGHMEKILLTGIKDFLE